MDVVIKGQVYARELDSPYVTRDGRTTMLVSLKSRCATCGASFGFTTTEWAMARGYLNRRCKTHKKPGKKVKSKTVSN